MSTRCFYFKVMFNDGEWQEYQFEFSQPTQLAFVYLLSLIGHVACDKLQKIELVCISGSGTAEDGGKGVKVGEGYSQTT